MWQPLEAAISVRSKVFHFVRRGNEAGIEFGSFKGNLAGFAPQRLLPKTTAKRGTEKRQGMGKGVSISGTVNSCTSLDVFRDSCSEHQRSKTRRTWDVIF